MMISPSPDSGDKDEKFPTFKRNKIKYYLCNARYEIVRRKGKTEPAIQSVKWIPQETEAEFADIVPGRFFSLGIVHVLLRVDAE